MQGYMTDFIVTHNFDVGYMLIQLRGAFSVFSLSFYLVL